MRFALFVLWLLHFLPLSAIDRLARPVGWLAYHLVKPRRRVGERNLAACFPDWTPAARDRLLRDHFHAMARLLLEYGVVWYSPDARFRDLVRYKNLHYLTDLRDENVIILYPHFVGFEMCVFRLNQDVPLVSVYSNQKNELLDRKIYEGRQRYGNCKIISRREGLRSIIKAMKDHTPFLYLPDQDFGARDSVFVPFFGVPTATITGMSRIARLTRARVVPVIPRRISAAQYELECFPAWDDFPSGDETEDARRMNAFIEERVREQPEQYFWLHKRFKTRPEGEPPFYA